MEQTGKRITFLLCLYLVIKQILNLILSVNVTNILMLLIVIVLSLLMILPSDTIEAIAPVFKYSNYITAVVVGINVIAYANNNISGLPGTTLYFIEGILDIVLIVLLFVLKPVRAYFKSK